MTRIRNHTTQASTETLHGGDTLAAEGMNLRPRVQHGATHRTQGHQPHDEYVATTPNAARAVIQRALPGNKAVGAQRRETARRAYEALRNAPPPADPRASLPPRPGMTIGELTHHQHEESFRTIRNSVISASVGQLGHVAGVHLAEHAAGPAATVATAVATHHDSTRTEQWHAAVEAGVDIGVEVAANHMVPGAGVLAQGATALPQMVVHVLADHEERRVLAQQWSAYDGARSQIAEDERLGRMQGEAVVALLQRGEIDRIDVESISRNYFAYQTVMARLGNWVGGETH